MGRASQRHSEQGSPVENTPALPDVYSGLNQRRLPNLSLYDRQKHLST